MHALWLDSKVHLFFLQTNESTALHLAAEGGYAEVVQALLDAGSNPKDENGVRLTDDIVYRHLTLLSVVWNLLYAFNTCSSESY